LHIVAGYLPCLARLPFADRVAMIVAWRQHSWIWIRVGRGVAATSRGVVWISSAILLLDGRRNLPLVGSQF